MQYEGLYEIMSIENKDLKMNWPEVLCIRFFVSAKFQPISLSFALGRRTDRDSTP